jgi:uncharacterized protein with PIN domain
MTTIIRKESPDKENYAVEIIDGERGIRSVVAEIKDYGICSEHASSLEIAECISAAIGKMIREKLK